MPKYMIKYHHYQYDTMQCEHILLYYGTYAIDYGIDIKIGPQSNITSHVIT